MQSSEDTFATGLDYWRRTLREPAGWADGFADAERPAIPPGRTASFTFAADEGLEALLARVTKGTPLLVYAAAVAALQIVLSRYIGRTRVAIGSPPRRDAGGLEPAVVPIVSSIVPGRSFRTLLGNVRQSLLDGYTHQRVPAARLIHELDLTGVRDRCPLYAVGALLAGFHGSLPELRHDLTVCLTFAGSGTGPGLSGRIEYAPSLYRPATVARFARHVLHALSFGLARPDTDVAAVPLTDDDERLRIAPAPAYAGGADVPAHEVIAATARAHAGHVAIEAPDATMTYAELDERSDAVASVLVEHGIAPESLVGLCVPPGAAAIAAMLGVLKAGGAFVPIDPKDPQERIRSIAASLAVTLLAPEFAAGFPSDCRALLVEQTLVQRAPRRPVHVRVDLDHPAYVIYTSGSTGAPKGVVVPHRGLANLVRTQPAVVGILAGTRVLHHASLGFDASVWEILPSLAAGAVVCVAQPHEVAPGLPLVRTLQSRRIHVLTITPSSLAALGGAEPLPDLRTIVTAGEACPQNLASAWMRRHRLINAYGPTEATVCATTADITDGDIRPPIGNALRGVCVDVLDSRLAPAAPGVLGEIHIGGVTLARGYRNRPDLTAAAFLPDPFGRVHGGRLYRTGDVGRVLDDGRIDFRGRVDTQTKVRGFRVEVEEIEEHLRAHASVAQAAVAAVARADLRRLVAYVVLEDGARTTAAELGGFLAGRLPSYLVPSRIVPVAELPRTRSGKVDRRALADAGAADGATAPGGAATPSLVQDLVANAWRASLGLPVLGPDDNFFQVGGTSLVAIRLLGDLNRLFGIDLPVRAIFDAPTVRALSHRIAAALAGPEAAAEPRILPAPGGAVVPLSREQQHLWLLERLDRSRGTYNIAGAVRLRGAMNAGALQASADAIVARHHALRSGVIECDGQPVQQVAPHARAPFARIDLGALPPDIREDAARRAGSEAALAPFDLATPPLLRMALVELAPGDHLLAIALHHIVFDVWSMQIFANELATCYDACCNGVRAELPEVGVQYPDYAWWQRQSGDRRVEGDLAFWAEQLGGVAVPSRPARRRDQRLMPQIAATATLTVPAETTAALDRAARESEATLFMLCAAALTLVLRDAMGGEDVLLGMPVANRDRPELAQVIGVFVNTVVLRVPTAGARTFRDVLRRVRAAAVAALAHAQAPYDRVAARLGAGRPGPQRPLFSALLNLVDVPDTTPALRGLEAEPFRLAERPPKVDLELTVQRSAGALRMSLTYDRGLFDPVEIERMLADVRAWLDRASRDVDVDVLTAAAVAAADPSASSPARFPFERSV